jgi:hypothetical protein
MAKKVKAPVEINAEVKVKKTRVSVKKKDKNLDVVVDTPKVDVTVHADEEEKKFVLDSRKLDVEVTKTAEGTTVKVEAQTPLLKRAGLWVAHMMSKKFNKIKK